MTTAFRDGTRFALRARTAAEHERIDAAFGRLDLACADGLATFLAAQHMALRTVEPALRGASDLPALPARLAAIEADLAALGVGVPSGVGAPGDLDARDPLGVAYVVGGSALGGQILSRRRIASPDPRVRAAGAFMDDPRMMPYWRSVLGALRVARSDPDRIERLVQAAKDTFTVFDDALRGVERHGLD